MNSSKAKLVAKKKKPRNKFETDVAKQLRRAGAIFQYESERIPYVLARHYYPDFVIQTKLGLVYIECKGYLRPEHKSKLVAVKKQHPEMDLRILFYAPSKSNERWAIRNGFRFAYSKIPPEWILGL